jgi:hypothetical protein
MSSDLSLRDSPGMKRQLLILIAIIPSKEEEW